MKRNEESLWKHWDSIKRADIQVIGVLQKDLRRSKG
jgi:hypothetical protein